MAVQCWSGGGGLGVSKGAVKRWQKAGFQWLGWGSSISSVQATVEAGNQVTLCKGLDIFSPPLPDPPLPSIVSLK